MFQVDGSLTVCDSRSGGKITGGYNTENGGGLFVRGALTVEGGSVTGNASDKAGGGVYLDANATLQVSGTAQVAENTAQSVGNNVYLPDGKVIAIGSAGLSNGASIGVTTETPPGKDSPVNVSAAIQTDFSAYFVSDIGHLTRFDASASAPAIQFVQSALAVPWTACISKDTRTAKWAGTRRSPRAAQTRSPFG